MSPPEHIAAASEANVSLHLVDPLLRELLASSPTAKRLLLASLQSPETHCPVCLEPVADCERKYRRHRDWLRGDDFGKVPR